MAELLRKELLQGETEDENLVLGAESEDPRSKTFKVSQRGDLSISSLLFQKAEEVGFLGRFNISFVLFNLGFQFLSFPLLLFDHVSIDPVVEGSYVEEDPISYLEIGELLLGGHPVDRIR